jgi:hypothetical protein
MPSLTTDQAAQIEQNLRGIAKTVENFRFDHMSDLSDTRLADLQKAETSLLKASEALNTAEMNLVMDDADGAIAGLGKVTGLLKADVSKLADVTKGLEIATAFIQIGTAVASGNLNGIASGIESAVKALSPAKPTTKSAASSKDGQSEDGAADGS